MRQSQQVVCFSRLLKCLRSRYGKHCVDQDQTAPIGTVCSGSTLFASLLNSSVMLGNFLQQRTFLNAFFLGPLRVHPRTRVTSHCLCNWIERHVYFPRLPGILRISFQISTPNIKTLHPNPLHVLNSSC